MKKLILIILLTSTVLKAEEFGLFNFVLEYGNNIDSVSGYRIPNGDGTDTIQVYNPGNINYSLLVDDGTGLAVPTTVYTSDIVWLEVTITNDTWILGAIEHGHLRDIIIQQQFQTAGILSSILILIFILSWHAQKLTK